jgi:hypothetical protein
LGQNQRDAERYTGQIEMDHDQRLHIQKDKRNEEKTMSVDENVIFREATVLCNQT